MEDLVGRQFGRLTVLSFNGRVTQGSIVSYMWDCACSCGRCTVVSRRKLMSGSTKSCGCLRSENRNNLQHGHASGGTRSRTFRIWLSMRSRCRTGTACYTGVTICQEWVAFAAFLSDMGECPDGHTLDRLDNSRGYSKGNCRWATPKQQANNRTNNLVVTSEHGTTTIKQLSELCGIPYYTLRARIKILGWDVDRAIHTNPRKA